MKIRTDIFDFIFLVGLIAIIAGLVVGNSTAALAGAGAMALVFVFKVFKVLGRMKSKDE